MSIVAKEIRCSHCSAPVEFKSGEIVATCKYCGFTTVIQTGQAFNFEHSLVLNNYDTARMEKCVQAWMSSGFMKPSDLAKKSKIVEKDLIYLPFWVISAVVATTYKGIFERISPPVMKNGQLEKEHNWLILARKATVFPTREYIVPLAGKIPYDFRKIEASAKVLNSEISKDDALELTKQQIENHHRFLLQQDIDRVIESSTVLELKQMLYLHAPIWFIKYQYKGNLYQLIIDGSTGNALKGDIPSTRF
jgi:DNA-directed RNA polymerase subunit RPC12/RpoP